GAQKEELPMYARHDRGIPEQALRPPAGQGGSADSLAAGRTGLDRSPARRAIPTHTHARTALPRPPVGQAEDHQCPTRPGRDTALLCAGQAGQKAADPSHGALELVGARYASQLAGGAYIGRHGGPGRHQPAAYCRGHPVSTALGLNALVCTLLAHAPRIRARPASWRRTIVLKRARVTENRGLRALKIWHGICVWKH